MRCATAPGCRAWRRRHAVRTPPRRRADRHLLVRVAEQIAQHADIARVRQFDQHGDIGTVVLAAPDAPDASSASRSRCGLCPPPRPSACPMTGSDGRAIPAPIARRCRHRSAAPSARPAASPSQIGQIEPVAFRDRRGQSWRQVGSSQRLLRADDHRGYGVTIGPAITQPTCASGTWRSTGRGSAAPPRSAVRGRACSIRPGCRRWCSAAACRLAPAGSPA